MLNVHIDYFYKDKETINCNTFQNKNVGGEKKTKFYIVLYHLNVLQCVLFFNTQ